MIIMIENYLHASGGSVSEYRENLYLGQRVGQAFFNALSGEDQQKLAGTLCDPFYKTDAESIEIAIDFLLGVTNLPN